MQDLVGLPLAEARRRLAGAGLSVTVAVTAAPEEPARRRARQVGPRLTLWRVVRAEAGEAPGQVRLLVAAFPLPPLPRADLEAALGEAAAGSWGPPSGGSLDAGAPGGAGAAAGDGGAGPVKAGPAETAAPRPGGAGTGPGAPRSGWGAASAAEQGSGAGRDAAGREGEGAGDRSR